MTTGEEITYISNRYWSGSDNADKTLIIWYLLPIRMENIKCIYTRFLGKALWQASCVCWKER